MTITTEFTVMIATRAALACAPDDRENAMEDFYRADVAEHGPIDWSTYCKTWWDVCIQDEFGDHPLNLAIQKRLGR